MRPLDVDEDTRAIERLLASAPSSSVREAIAAALGAAADPIREAALTFADGALALREGDLQRAGDRLRAAADAFGLAREAEASELARVDADVADVRRGVRALALSARDRLAELSTEGATERVRVAALIARGTAERVLGDAAAAQLAFLQAKDRAGSLPDLKTQALTSLGTLYVVTGALGAARSVLEPSAELCHARGDTLGEAIATGQLGAVAFGLGDLPLARQRLSRQEWLARQVGDDLGRARALVWLADVALEMGAADDAIEIGSRALALARSSRLRTFEAYAERVIGRARRHLGEDGTSHTEAALSIFADQRLPLGEALCTWDLAIASTPVDRARLDRALRALASLGLVDRVLEVLSDLRERAHADVPGARSPGVPLLLMTSALSGRRSEGLESALVHEDPGALATAAGERTGARRNLGRLATLSVARAGLVLLAVDGGATVEAALGDRSFEGALAGALGPIALFAWAADVEPALIAKDVALALGTRGRGALARSAAATIVAPGFGGGTTARLDGVSLAPLVRAALEGSDEARALALTEGFAADDLAAADLVRALEEAGLALRTAIG